MRQDPKWQGKATITPRDGGYVVLGDVAIPSAVVYELAGARSVPGRGWPDVTARFEVRDGVPQCVEVRVVSKPGDRPVRTPDLHLLDLDVLTSLAFRTFAQDIDAERGLPRAGGPQTRKRAQTAMRRMQDRAEVSPIRELEAVARAYLDPVSGRRRAQAVMDILGYGSLDTAHRRINAAVAAGLVPPVGHRTRAELDAAWVRLEERLRTLEPVEVSEEQRRQRDKLAELLYGKGGDGGDD